MPDADRPRRRLEESRWSERRREPRFEQRLDQWVTAGRQLVDGVAGARPGSRPAPRLRLDSLGRWVEDKLDWLLEDEEGWREPWEAPTPRELSARPTTPQEPAAARRRPLEAISRRRSVAPGAAPLDANGTPGMPAAAEPDWPDDQLFSVNRWQRSTSSPVMPQASAPSQPPAGGRGRAVPRSSRRRFD